MANTLDGIFTNNETSNVTVVRPAFVFAVLQVEEGETGNIQFQIGLTDDGQIREDKVRLCCRCPIVLDIVFQIMRSLPNYVIS